MFKDTSGNIKATAAIVPLRNLNVFENIPFKDVLQILSDTINRNPEGFDRDMTLVNDNCTDYYCSSTDNEKFFSIAMLSTPLLTIQDNIATLQSNFLVWGNRLLNKGSQVNILTDEILTPDSVEKVVIVDADFKLMHYDTYNGMDLTSIDKDILSELDIQMDVDSVTEWEGEDSYNMVKYISVYAPNIPPVEAGTRVIAINKYDSPENAIMQFSETFFDAFMVEFVDPTQPFAYISVEIVNDLNYAEGDNPTADNFKDTFKDIFNDVTSDLIKYANGADMPLSVLNTELQKVLN